MLGTATRAGCPLTVNPRDPPPSRGLATLLFPKKEAREHEAGCDKLYVKACPLLLCAMLSPSHPNLLLL